LYSDVSADFYSEILKCDYLAQIRQGDACADGLWSKYGTALWFCEL